jgi:hypothetical protein
LNYYIYQDGPDVVLEAIGNLPLHLSASTTAGKQCPIFVPQGGTNSWFFCVGPRVGTLRLFPIFNVFQSLPLNLMSFTNATGTSSGLFIFRDAIGIDARTPVSVKYPGLDYVDFAGKSIKTNGNITDIVTKDGAVDGDTIALWNLLSEYPENEGKPVDSGKIKLFMGPPPTTARNTV